MKHMRKNRNRLLLLDDTVLPYALYFFLLDILRFVLILAGFMSRHYVSKSIMNTNKNGISISFLVLHHVSSLTLNFEGFSAGTLWALLF